MHEFVIAGAQFRRRSNWRHLLTISANQMPQRLKSSECNYDNYCLLFSSDIDKAKTIPGKPSDIQYPIILAFSDTCTQ